MKGRRNEKKGMWKNEKIGRNENERKWREKK